MDEILCVLLCHLGDLYKRLGFRFTDSEYDNESFGNAFIVMENERIQILLEVDRGQFAIYLLPRGADADWIPLETFADYFKFPLSRKSYSDTARTLFEIFPRIEELFSDSLWKSSRKRLENLSRVLGVRRISKRR